MSEFIGIALLLFTCFLSLKALLYFYEVPEEPLSLKQRFKKPRSPEEVINESR